MNDYEIRFALLSSLFYDGRSASSSFFFSKANLTKLKTRKARIKMRTPRNFNTTVTLNLHDFVTEKSSETMTQRIQIAVFSLLPGHGLYYTMGYS